MSLLRPALRFASGWGTGASSAFLALPPRFVLVVVARLPGTLPAASQPPLLGLPASLRVGRSVAPRLPARFARLRSHATFARSARSTAFFGGLFPACGAGVFYSPLVSSTLTFRYQLVLSMSLWLVNRKTVVCKPSFLLTSLSEFRRHPCRRSALAAKNVSTFAEVFFPLPRATATTLVAPPIILGLSGDNEWG